AVKYAFQTAIEWTGNQLVNLWDAIKRGFQGFIQSIVDAWHGTIDGIKKAWTVFKNAIVGVYESVRDWIVGATFGRSLYVCRALPDIQGGYA
ncbi:unnamed protein product, partial [marine sediment metagenome]